MRATGAGGPESRDFPCDGGMNGLKELLEGDHRLWRGITFVSRHRRYRRRWRALARLLFASFRLEPRKRKRVRSSSLVDWPVDPRLRRERARSAWPAGDGRPTWNGFNWTETPPPAAPLGPPRACRHRGDRRAGGLGRALTRRWRLAVEDDGFFNWAIWPSCLACPLDSLEADPRLRRDRAVAVAVVGCLRLCVNVVGLNGLHVKINSPENQAFPVSAFPNRPVNPPIVPKRVPSRISALLHLAKNSYQ